MGVVMGAALLAGAGTIVITARAADVPKAPKAAAPAARPALTVTTVRAQASELANKLSANGNIAAWQETIIGAEVNGLRLTDVRVNVGDIVKRGQVLASFSPETVNA